MNAGIPFAAGLILGAAVIGLIGASKVDQLRLEWTQAHAAELAQSLEQIKAAHQRGDEAAKRLGAALAENVTLKSERDRALLDATAGRECLSAAAVRVLNRGVLEHDFVIDEYEIEDFELVGYEAHPNIPAPIAV